MTALVDLQLRFQDRLLTGADGIEMHLAGGGPFLKVYDHAYVARQQEVLAEQFPAVHALFGDERFSRATRDYVHAHPSATRSARWIGNRFADWLRADNRWKGQPVLADMAAFEWTLGLAFDAPDDATLGLGSLASVSPDLWPALTFDLHPSLHVVVLSHDVGPFQQAVARGNEPGGTPPALAAPRPWAAWRDTDSLIVRYRDLVESEIRGLTAVRSGTTFAGLCDILARDDPDNAAALAAGYLRNWIESGWISDVAAEGMSLNTARYHDSGR